MRERVKRIFKNVDDHLDLIVLMNSTEPHIDMSFFYATGVTDGIFEGCAAWLHPDGSAEIMTSALEGLLLREAEEDLYALQGDPPLHAAMPPLRHGRATVPGP